MMAVKNVLKSRAGYVRQPSYALFEFAALKSQSAGSSMSLAPGARTLSHHITLRVPWHDLACDGTACNPTENANSCVLKCIAENRDDAQWTQHTAKLLAIIQQEDRPPLRRRARRLDTLDAQAIVHIIDKAIHG